jgi:hypothetical protein
MKSSRTKEALKEELLDEYYRLREETSKGLTAWDVVYSYLVRQGAEGYLITLKADIEILKLIAEGLSVSSISNRLGTSSKSVLTAANLWGMEPLELTLDFNPFLVYNNEDTPDSLMAKINEILAIPINRHTAKTLIYNIEKYYDFIDFIEEEDE